MQRCAAAQGRVVWGLEVRVSDLDGTALPNDGVAVGEIQIRGPWVTQSYLDVKDQAHLQDGWLRTGDLGTVDADGFIYLTDRIKDAIKSGDEWIPSLALENAIRSHPAVLDVAMIAVLGARWQERPAALVVLRKGESADASELQAYLGAKVAKRWILERWAFAEQIPRRRSARSTRSASGISRTRRSDGPRRDGRANRRCRHAVDGRNARAISPF
ncbi:putative fatty acid CoA ligase [Candidatus Paraburkholderia calva]|nr:putative fatty acid CoA ligase [Candidatus Paraburkholderia calva]